MVSQQKRGILIANSIRNYLEGLQLGVNELSRQNIEGIMVWEPAQ